MASASTKALLALLPLLPSIAALTPNGRWGHQAIYVNSQQSLYIVGGQVQTPGTQITNDVLVFPLNSTNPSWQSGTSTNLPPHAFASAALSLDGNSLMVVGGMTSDCSSDALAHTLHLSSSSSGWVHANPNNFVRRRDQGIGMINDGTTEGKLMVVGGVSDQYSCGSSTNTFPAADILSLPLGASSVISTRTLPTDLTGSSLAVSDFAMTTSKDGSKLYMVGGQDSSGSLIGMDTIGVWSSSTGWTSQKVGGNIPVGRVGAELVAHPSLDLLVLHGGARDNRGSDLSTSLLALLNTTSWTWSVPANLQPPQSSATSYHSAVMVPPGVMITTFGISASNTPRSDVYYLDMRDPTGSAWTWKSVWSNSMLSPYVSPTTSGTNGVIAPVNNNTDSAASNNNKKVISIAVPIIIVCVLAIPVIIFFIRRKIRIAKKRRLARHFSFSSQEDEGDFTTPLTQFLGRGGGRRRTKTEYTFGQDANEKEGTFMDDVRNSVTGFIAGVMTRIPGMRSGSDNNMMGGQGMIDENGNRRRKSKISEKSMKWEEIDFGLGKIDSSRRGSAVDNIPSSRRSSFSATGSPPLALDNSGRYVDSMMVPMSMPLAMASGVTYNPGPSPATTYNFGGSASQGNGNMAMAAPGPLLISIHDHDSPSPRVGTPISDGQQPLIPSLVVLPPLSPSALGPAFNPTTPVSPISPISPMKKDQLDWSMLENEMNEKPAFRSISPTSPLRSHQASHQELNSSPRRGSSSSIPGAGTQNPFSDRNAVNTPSTPKSNQRTGPLPYLPSSDSNSPTTRTITLVNPKTGRRTSETLPLTTPGTPPPLSSVTGQTSRSVSSPISPISPISPLSTRQLVVGSSVRRSSLGTNNTTSTYSIPPSPTSTTASGTPTIGTAARFDPMVRRASNPTLITPTPASSAAVNQPGSLNGRRGSQLRVCNASEQEEEFRGQAF